MDNKTNHSLDSLKIGQNKKFMKLLEDKQIILMSATVIKINHVNKRQERALIITNIHVINAASPNSFFSNRIKRKIYLGKILGITTSRFGNEVVIHVDNEDDYRFFSPNLKTKFIESIVIAVGKLLHNPLKIYYYDDLSLQQYTTTILDVDKKYRKPHKCEPTIMDEDGLLKNQNHKPQSKLIFKGQNSDNIFTFEEFDIIKVLGRGAFGKVMLCKHKNSQIYFAVKSMRKEDLIEKESLERTKTERYLLEKVEHPFLVNLEYAFQTKQKIFLVMKFYRGGEMFSKIRKQTRFNEQRAKFYAAQVFLALQCIHKMGFVYRDLKPENILFDVNGYIKVSDYGLSKKVAEGQKTYSITGTPSYISPEVIMHEGHGHSVDWWALGILIYEMLFSSPPFYNRDQKEMFKLIINKEIQFPKDVQISQQCKSIIKGLLHKYPHKRLGHENSNNIRNHPWFNDMDWQKLYKMELKPEYIPVLSSEQDVSNFLQNFTKQEPIDSIVQSDSYLLNKHQKQFEGFNFQRLISLQQNNKKIPVNPEYQNRFSNEYSAPSATSFKKK